MRLAPIILVELPAASACRTPLSRARTRGHAWIGRAALAQAGDRGVGVGPGCMP